ncbi:hypothetical protein AB0D11_46395 [Streptomyces monashensis]|uniref:hypothetical protein n=1 Tax=Streptomyces monashensis TaxID=1678012 RepID=UPI0033DA990B
MFDIDPVRRAHALSQGFTVARGREASLTRAGLVLCATGAMSLGNEDFSRLRNSAYVATVTSSEDELDLAGLPDVYTRTQVADHVTRYQTTGHYFYLANGSNAVNFIHGASVRPFTFLVQAEILPAIRMLTRAEFGPRHTRGPCTRPRSYRGDLALLLQQVTTMTITADHIRTTLAAYVERHPSTQAELDVFTRLLDDGDDLTSRKTAPGHVTAGAILIGPTTESCTSTTTPPAYGFRSVATSNPPTAPSSMPPDANSQRKPASRRTSSTR